MVEEPPMFAARELPKRFAGVEFDGVTGEADDAGGYRRCGARAADAGPAAVDAGIHRDARRTAGFGGYVGDGPVGAVRILLPRGLRNTRSAGVARIGAAGAGAVPKALAILRTALGELRAAHREHGGEHRRTG